MSEDLTYRRGRTSRRASTRTRSLDAGALQQLFSSGFRKGWIVEEGKKAEEQVRKSFESFVPISWCNPINASSYLEGLRAGCPITEPLRYQEFDFHQVRANLLDSQNLVHGLESHPLSSAVEELLARAVRGCEAFATVRATPDSQELTDWSIAHYGRPNEAVLETAWGILLKGGRSGLTAPDASGDLSSQEACDAISAVLARVAPDWSAQTGHIQANMMVRSGTRAVLVKDTLTISKTELRRLLVHEIGSHVLRHANARRAPGSFASLPLGADAGTTEEGLAAWWEHSLRVQDTAVMRMYAARAIAVDIALSKPDYEVVEILSPLVGVKAAAMTTLRVKRGMADPSRPGALTKDHQYLTGYLRLRDAAAVDPRVPELLMSAKWGLSLLPMFEQFVEDGIFADPQLPSAEQLGIGEVGEYAG